MKKIVKTIKIENCVECPNSAVSLMSNLKDNLCCYHIDILNKKIVERLLNKSGQIPKWCPL
jgi:alkyl hydroperoxide reductase subunit AhpF